jgi:predicted nuclease of restriction endonuclease-like (RecB) superfamily
MGKSNIKNKAADQKDYKNLFSEISILLDNARKFTATSVNAILTASYWLIGKRIVEFEYHGMERAEYYGDKLLENLSSDLKKKYGKGFSRQNLQLMKQFYEIYPLEKISQTPSGKSSKTKEISQTLSVKSLTKISIDKPDVKIVFEILSKNLPLSWSQYVSLITVKDADARIFYEKEALRNGWSVRQLNRQISSQFYERSLLSKNKAAMLKKGEKAIKDDLVTPEEEIKDPYILEFLGLKDEYSENDLEEALIKHLENFLLELGSDFAFIGRQKRLRIGTEWYRIDLLFFHRKLRCLVVIDLKVGKFTHADAGQMHMYLNYAKDNWTNKDENPPVGLILCAQNDTAVAKYSLEGLPNKVLAAEYKLKLPNEKVLVNELKKTQKALLK